MAAADTATRSKAHLIAPHGGELVDRTVSGAEAGAGRPRRLPGCRGCA